VWIKYLAHFYTVKDAGGNTAPLVEAFFDTRAVMNTTIQARDTGFAGGILK
jgi:hypothetical protein